MGGDLIFAIPLTGDISPINQDFCHLFTEWQKYGLDKPSYLLYNQAMSVSRDRLVRKLNDYFYQSVHYIPLIPEEILEEIERTYLDTYTFYTKKNPELQ
jgi:hypothetical protein